jgi:hypothetical protein
MAFVARIALFGLLLSLQVLGAASLSDQPGSGAAEVTFDLDSADENDAADPLVVEWTHPHFIAAEPLAGAHDLAGPEGPALPLADRPPNV